MLSSTACPDSSGKSSLSADKAGIAGKMLLQTLFFFLLVTQISFAQWVQVGLGGESIQDIAVLNSKIFAVTSDTCDYQDCVGKVFRSVDNGANWTMIVDSFAVDVTISPSGKVFMIKNRGTFDKKLFYSLDDGITWTHLSMDSTGCTGQTNIAVSPEGILYCGLETILAQWSGSFLARSTDDGLIWIPSYIYGGALFSFNCEFVITIGWVGHDGFYIHLSSDNGSSWTDIGDPPHYSPHAPAIFSNGNITIGDNDNFVNHIYISTDTGSTWSIIAILNSQVGLFWSSGSEEGILIGTEDLGVFLFSDEGDSLGSRNDGLTNLNVQALTLDNNGYIYTGTDNGLWRRPLFEVIPVELTLFTAISNGEGVILSWSTVTEINNSGFSIERKSANSEYSEIGFVPGFGTTTEPKSYSFTDSKVSIGKYTYRLKQIDFDGSYEYSQEVEVEVSVPLEFLLAQNYPNPFNPSTVISYQLPVSSNVTLKVYDLLGDEVATLVDEYKKVGKYEVDFNSLGIRQLASGIYFYQLKASNFIQTRKMLLIK